VLKEINTYYSSAFNDLIYYVSPEQKLYSHYILRYITCINSYGYPHTHISYYLQWISI